METMLLKSKIVLCGKSVNEICDDVEISRAAWYRKLSGDSEFTRREIVALANSLCLDEADVISIFFSELVSAAK